MKIRIKGNSVRFRLTKSEVERLRSASHLEEQTEFSGKTFAYAIEVTNGNKLSADFIGDKIMLNMPKVMIDELSNTARVGFEDLTGPVNLLIEKDFACIDNTDEDQSDHYPNPHVAC